MRREDELFGEAYLMAERFGDLDSLRFSRGDRIWTRWALGHWDEADRAAEEFIAECASSPHYLEASAARFGLTCVSLAVTARAPWTITVDLSSWHDRSRIFKRCYPACSNPLVASRCSARSTRRRHSLEKQSSSSGSTSRTLQFSGCSIPSRGDWGFGSRCATWWNGARGPLEGVALAGAGGNFRRAADLFAAHGSPTFEAEARLCAAEELIEAGQRAEGEAELQKALAFYRQVGATGYIRQGEALFAASA